MEYTMFADESGTHDGSLCFTIGCLLIPSEQLDTFENQIKDLITKHNIPDNELKWEGIRNSHGRINFMIDIMKLLLSDNPYFFTSKVTLKSSYRKWNSNEEEAFYTCHTHLIAFCAKNLKANIIAKIDNKSDAYNKHDEVVQIIANYKLQDNDDGNVQSVSKEDSKKQLLIQIADLLTGAINSSHAIYLDPKCTIHNGKQIAIGRLANCLGWQYLHHDTYPNTYFNIWHFPKDYRAKPSTEEVKADFDVPFVTRDDF